MEFVFSAVAENFQTASPTQQMKAKRAPELGAEIPFDLLKLFRLGHGRVEFVQRVATALDAVSRRRRAIAERAADLPGNERSFGRGIGENVGITQHDPPQPDHVRPIVSQYVLRHMREIFLKIGITRANYDHSGTDPLFDLPNHLDLSLNVDQRIVSRLVAIARRIRSRPLQVRCVIGRSGRGVQNLHPQIAT